MSNWRIVQPTNTIAVNCALDCVLSTMTMAGIGAAAGGVGLIRTMTPTRDVAGGGVIEVSLEGISEGSGIIATAGRKKYSIRRRTAEEIAAAVADDASPTDSPDEGSNAEGGESSTIGHMGSSGRRPGLGEQREDDSDAQGS